MGEKHNEDPLTYEQLQHLIDQRLAHFDELQAKEELKDIDKLINPADSHLEKKSRLVIFWQSLKKLIAFVFKHNK